MRLPSWRSMRMWQRNRDVFFRLWWSIAPGFMIEPIILLVALGFGFGNFMGIVDGQEYIHFIVPGILASYIMTSATFECTYGTFSAWSIAAPTIPSWPHRSIWRTSWLVKLPGGPPAQ